MGATCTGRDACARRALSELVAGPVGRYNSYERLARVDRVGVVERRRRLRRRVLVPVRTGERWRGREASRRRHYRVRDLLRACWSGRWARREFAGGGRRLVRVRRLIGPAARERHDQQVAAIVVGGGGGGVAASVTVNAGLGRWGRAQMRTRMRTRKGAQRRPKDKLICIRLW